MWLSTVASQSEDRNIACIVYLDAHLSFSWKVPADDKKQYHLL